MSRMPRIREPFPVMGVDSRRGGARRVSAPLESGTWGGGMAGHSVATAQEEKGGA